MEEREKRMDTRVITMPSQTLAIKAQRLLQKGGISVQIVRPNPKETPHGCTWGLKISVFSVNRAILLMREEGIPIGGIMNI